MRPKYKKDSWIGVEIVGDDERIGGKKKCFSSGSQNTTVDVSLRNRPTSIERGKVECVNLTWGY